MVCVQSIQLMGTRLYDNVSGLEREIGMDLRGKTGEKMDGENYKRK